MEITDLSVTDVRFATSRDASGSDAMHGNPDYSAAYVVLETDAGRSGYGLGFTLGRGNELVVAAVRSLRPLVVGRGIDGPEDLTTLYRAVVGDPQLRWVGPEKGVLHLAAAAVMNAAWDLASRAAGRPLWQYVSELTPDELADVADLRYLTDVIDRAAARDRFAAMRESQPARLEELRRDGYPAYTTSAGWLGYSDGKIRRLCREGIAAGWTHFKVKVGRDRDDDRRRVALVREEIGPDRHLMVDANQVWEVDQAIDWMETLAEYRPLWIEEPTSPDDILGHARIADALRPHGIGVATGEVCQNRVMFKQFLQAGGMDYCQLDSCRLAGVHEILGVMLLAAHFGVPVCPHAGGVGLCEFVNHLVMIDCLCVSGAADGRVAEFVDHLHEHFTDPCVVAAGRYRLPTAPGYGGRMHEESVRTHRHP